VAPRACWESSGLKHWQYVCRQGGATREARPWKPASCPANLALAAAAPRRRRRLPPRPPAASTRATKSLGTAPAAAAPPLGQTSLTTSSRTSWGRLMTATATVRWVPVCPAMGACLLQRRASLYQHNRRHQSTNIMASAATPSPPRPALAGSHVASTAAGRAVGVAPGAQVVAVRVLDCEGSGAISDVVAGAPDRLPSGRPILWRQVPILKPGVRVCRGSPLIVKGVRPEPTAQPALDVGPASCSTKSALFPPAPGPRPRAALDWLAANARRPAVVTLSLGVPIGSWSEAMDQAVRSLVTKRRVPTGPHVVCRASRLRQPLAAAAATDPGCRHC
jgi:subtilisin family serine protease